MNAIEDLESSDKQYFDKIKARDYKCPCGKAYLSYPALFTHIKQKHQGKPPGKIIKPGPNNMKRGRPPSKAKYSTNEQIQLKNEQQKNNYFYLSEESIQQHLVEKNPQFQSKKQVLLDKLITDIVCVVQQLSPINAKKSQVNSIGAFTQILVIIHKLQAKAQSKSNTNMKQKINVAEGIIQFLKQVSEKTTWTKFQQLFVLFMLFLQFIIDEQNNKNILKTASMDILVENINQFYQNHLYPLAQYYQIDNMEILRQDLTLTVFNILFNWMMVKKYTSFSISMNSSKKCSQSHFQDY